MAELANTTAIVEAHTQTLAELAALPDLCERLHAQERAIMQQELQAALRAHTEQHRSMPVPNTERPKLSVVVANSEQRTPKDRTGRANRNESDKGAFVRRCLSDTPNIRNTDIQRKASEQGMTISPAYISEIRKAFTREQTA